MLQKNFRGSVLPETEESHYSTSRTSPKLLSPDARFFTKNAPNSISVGAHNGQPPRPCSESSHEKEKGRDRDKG